MRATGVSYRDTVLQAPIEVVRPKASDRAHRDGQGFLKDSQKASDAALGQGFVDYPRLRETRLGTGVGIEVFDHDSYNGVGGGGRILHEPGERAVYRSWSRRGRVHDRLHTVRLDGRCGLKRIPRDNTSNQDHERQHPTLQPAIPNQAASYWRFGWGRGGWRQRSRDWGWGHSPTGHRRTKTI